MTTSSLSAADARRAARNAGAIALARIISSAAQFGWQIILGRALGESTYGVYGAVNALFAVGVTVASFSISLIAIREVARRPERAGRYWSAALFIQTVTSLIAYLGINAAALGYDEVIRAYAAIAGLSLFIDTVGTHCYDQLLAQERMVATSLVEIGHIAARLLLAGVAVALGFGLVGVYMVTLLTGVGRAVVLWVLLRRTGVRPLFPADRGVIGSLLRDAAPLTLYAFIGMMYTQIDRLLTTGLLTEADTGQLTAAMVIVMGSVEILSTTVLVALYPLLSRAAENAGDSLAFRFIVEKLAFFTLLIVAPLWLVFAFFSPAIIVPLFGASYAPAAEVLRALMGFAAATMVSNVFAQAMFAQNRQRRLVLFRVVGLIAKLGLSLALLPRIGVIGAAFAAAISEIGVLTLLTIDFRVEWRRMGLRVLRLGAVVLAASVAMALFGGLYPLAGMALGGAVYAAGLLIGRVLAQEEWDLLYRLAAAMPGGGLVLRYWKRETPINW
ncbi:MAG: flippase [Chloroflexi bacterium]|nr:flippase [Chloroflexota bacterium]